MNIKEIAKLAGVSVSSVSRVINKQPGVRREARERIKKIIDDTNYRPNLIARGLVQKKTNAIGLMVPRFHGYYSRIVDAVIRECNNRNYSVIITGAVGKFERETDNFYLLYERQVEGIVYYAAKITDEHKKILREIHKKIPITLIGHKFDEYNVSSVLHDDYGGAKKAIEYLINNGHRKIALIKGPVYDMSAMERHRAYVDILKSHNIEINEEIISEGINSIETGFEAMNEILDKTKDITAVFASNDNMAIGAIKAIFKRGLSVPEDISVVGFDDIEFAENYRPALTTVHQNLSGTGKNAIELLFKQIETRGKDISDVVLTNDLVVRESTRKIN